ncbi:MAG: nucleoside deaminase, partial [Saprospiraceae bacterium]|nr:nucleoside deaminase [Saprospiraceae bacterium]
VNFKGSQAFMESHGTEVINLQLEECIHMMKDFIKQNPELWNEDIGC